MLLLVLVCVNVGILVYVRTATRQGEIAVRSALGASRRRIVLQLFIEAPADSGGAPAVVYHAASPASLYPAMLAVRVRGSAPSSFASRLRSVAAGVDPNLQLRDISTTDEIIKREQGLMRLIGVTLAVVMLSVVTLSGAGIYALMSFTVARRRKEIGIRAALGADQTRILVAIFSRALGQLAIGAVVGSSPRRNTARSRGGRIRDPAAAGRQERR